MAHKVTVLAKILKNRHFSRVNQGFSEKCLPFVRSDLGTFLELSGLEKTQKPKNSKVRETYIFADIGFFVSLQKITKLRISRKVDIFLALNVDISHI